MEKEEVRLRFECAAQDEIIVQARHGVLRVASEELAILSIELNKAASGDRNGNILRATGLLLAILKDLLSAITILFGHEAYYSAAALLRQIVEVEYLLFLAYLEPASLGRWLEASESERRRVFSPSSMRKASDHVFRDEEYWMHCRTGGHPSPDAVLLLAEYPQSLKPMAFLLPDAVQHTRRAMVSVQLLVPKFGEFGAGSLTAIASAIQRWQAVEDQVVVALHGINL